MVRTKAEIAEAMRRLAVQGVDAHYGNRLRGASKSLIDSAYSSGDPKTKRAGESAAANVTKKINVPFAIRPLAASLTVKEDPLGDETVIMGSVESVGTSGQILATQLNFALPVTPGTTNTHHTANTEHSKTGTGMDVYSDVKRFYLGRPGRYRVSIQLSRTGGSITSAKLQLELPDQTRIDASAEASSTTTNPSFSSHNLDMTITANHPGMFLVIQYKGTLTAQTAYIKNCVVKSDDAVTSPALYEAVITD